MKISIKLSSMNCLFTRKVLSLIGIGLIVMLSGVQAQNSPWTQKADLTTGRLGLATAVVNGKIYAIGGYPYANGERMATNEVFDPNKCTWECKTAMPTSRCLMSASTVNDKIYVFGGFTHVRDPGLSTSSLSVKYLLIKILNQKVI